MKNTGLRSSCTPELDPARNERGGASVYLLIILVALLLFHALLLDIVRFRMAQAETEQAARSAGRSIMSRYHAGLAKYGLFGLDWNEQEVDRTLASVFPSNAAKQTGGIFEISINKDHFQTEPYYHLGDHTVFRRQVLEKMKYLAGIEFAREVTQKISRGRQQIAQAKQYAQLSQKLESILKEREEQLDLSWAAAKSLVQTAISKSGDKDIKESETAALQEMLNTLSERLKKAEEANERLLKELNQPLTDGKKKAPAEDAVVPHVSVLPPDYFTLYVTKAGSVVSLFGAVAAASRQENEEAAKSAKATLTDFATDWLAAKSKEEQKRQQEQSQVRQLQADEKNKMENEVKKVAELWKDGCFPSGAEGYAGMIQAYQKAGGG